MAEKQQKGKSASPKNSAPATKMVMATAADAPGEKVTPRLRTAYAEKIIPAMQAEFAYGNPMQVPKLDKVVINFGLGEATQNPKVIERTVEQCLALAGQKPIVTRSRKAIANFKLRENLPIGVKVTLRRERMFEFLDRLISIALPRVRDFRGVSAKGFDGRGNFTMGVKEQIIFPEINYDAVDKVRGMNITVVTTAKTDAEAKALLGHFGMPFRK
jgi:large subunit ribosomal protein L5